MDGRQQADDPQEMLWNGAAGHAWVEERTLLDRLFKPFEDLLVESVSSRSATRVLDIGCGTGSTTRAVARQIGAPGHCVGIDISGPMIAVARASAEREHLPATFIRANAQTHAFEPASFDMLISRFGAMFFDEPVRAFANLRRAATDDAELQLFVWRSAAENPFMTAAERAAASLVPDFPARDLDGRGPGQFAFADPDRVRSVLEKSGWDEIDVEPNDVQCAFPEKDLLRYLTRLGPVGVMLQGLQEDARARVIETVRAAFDPFVRGTEVRFTAACWTVSARAGARARGCVGTARTDL
jgi:SAM-dependent methyltransferase